MLIVNLQPSRKVKVGSRRSVTISECHTAHGCNTHRDGAQAGAAAPMADVAVTAWHDVADKAAFAGGTCASADTLAGPIEILHKAGYASFAGDIALRLRQQQLAASLNPNLWADVQVRRER